MRPQKGVLGGLATEVPARCAELIGEVKRVGAQNEKLSGALSKLKVEHQAVKDELARLKHLPPQKPSGMDKSTDASRSCIAHVSSGPGCIP
jgi:hypothetical protein